MSDKQLILNTVQKVDETTSYEEILYTLYTQLEVQKGIKDLGSRNGVRIQDAKDGKVYQVSREHPCRINAGDIIFIGNTRLGAK